MLFATENLRLEKECCDLVVGFNSLFFCRPEKFKDFFQNIIYQLKIRQLNNKMAR